MPDPGSDRESSISKGIQVPDRPPSFRVHRNRRRLRGVCDRCLAEIKSYVPENPGIRSSLDYRNADKLTAKQQEEILLELLATGNRIGALRAARHLYGFDTTRAVEFLEELSPARPKKDD